MSETESSTPLADALAVVDRAQADGFTPDGTARRHLVKALYALSEAVRLHLSKHPEQIKTAQWRPANNGTGKYRWFLTRDDNSLPMEQRYYFRSAKGSLRLVRFASCENAQRAADHLNAQQATS